MALKRIASATILLVAGFHGGWAVDASSTPFWYDSDTGIAMGGFDPLAYVIYGEPRPGKPDNELTVDGLTWRFVNSGNRDAFNEAIGVYSPAFGGYDAVGVSRGVLSQANPVIWLIHEGQLLLFFSPAHKKLFEQDKAGILAKARRNWPRLARGAPRWPGSN